ncbi:zinc finger, CCHC-type containing protein [Tanacetum coccineum]
MTMTRSAKIDMAVEDMKNETKELQNDLKSLPDLMIQAHDKEKDELVPSEVTVVPLIDVIPLVSFASLLIETASRIEENMVKAVEELAESSQFILGRNPINRGQTTQHGKEESFSQDYNEEMRKPRDFSKVKCYNCNEYGHYASHCRKRDQRQQRREASNLVEEDLEPTLLMASTSFNKTQRKSSKDTPTNKSIWFAKDYDHEDSKFGEIILEEDEGGHDQDYDKLRLNENEDFEDTAIVITGENIGPKPNQPDASVLPRSVFVRRGATGAALKILTITSLKCVLTQEHLDAICAKYFVPEEVHPLLPSSDATMHERTTGKVEMYTRFFDYANYHRAPVPYEYNVEHINALIAQASPFLRFPEEFLCWVGISRNYLLNKDTYPRFEYENGEEMDLNAFIRIADPCKVRIVERARAKNERPIVTVAKHRTVTLLPTSVVCSSGELSASVEREFIGDASVGDGEDQGFDSIGGQDNVEPIVPVTEHVETEIPGPKRSKKK